jgi:hypothetical protein
MNMQRRIQQLEKDLKEGISEKQVRAYVFIPDVEKKPARLKTRKR